MQGLGLIYVILAGQTCNFIKKEIDTGVFLWILPNSKGTFSHPLSEKWKLAWLYLSNLFSFLEILPKTGSVCKLEREEKRFVNMWENCHSSDFQLQWKLDFWMNGSNLVKLVDLVYPTLGKYDTQLRKAIPTEKWQNSW